MEFILNSWKLLTFSELLRFQFSRLLQKNIWYCRWVIKTSNWKSYSFLNQFLQTTYKRKICSALKIKFGWVLKHLNLLLPSNIGNNDNIICHLVHAMWARYLFHFTWALNPSNKVKMPAKTTLKQCLHIHVYTAQPWINAAKVCVVY